MAEEKVVDAPEVDSDVSRVYEVSYHLVGSLSEEQVAGKAGEIKSLLEKVQAEIIAEEMPKLRPLAYEIAKVVGAKKTTYDKAYFGWIKFATLASHIEKIEEALESNENVLRFLLIKTVRESTLAPILRVVPGQRIDKENKGTKVPAEALKEKKPVSVEEIDKSIDELLKA